MRQAQSPGPALVNSLYVYVLYSFDLGRSTDEGLDMTKNIYYLFIYLLCV